MQFNKVNHGNNDRKKDTNKSTKSARPYGQRETNHENRRFVVEISKKSQFEIATEIAVFGYILFT